MILQLFFYSARYEKAYLRRCEQTRLSHWTLFVFSHCIGSRENEGPVLISNPVPKNRLRIFPKITFGKFALLSLGVGLVLGGLLTYALYRFVQRELPDVAVLNHKYPLVLYRAPKEPVKIKLVGGPPPGWVRIDQIAKSAVGAIVVSEDWAFFSHDGFDANQLKEAIKEDLADRQFSRGASTITMQVVKNVFLSQEKTLYRKAKEFILALRLDRHVPKKKVLEVYFNIAEWGEGVFGIGGAAKRYFGKTPLELTPKEGAFLAMLLPSPKRYSQSFRDGRLTPYASKTVRSILGKMVQAHYISEEERDAANALPLPFETSSSAESEIPAVDEEALPAPDSSEGDTLHELDLNEAGG
jgi:monofunctional glycosyltransferase